MHQSFLTYHHFKYFKISITLIAVSVFLYIWHTPVQSPNGGTWLGYGLGTVGALLIFWLMWFGIRKRQYASSSGTVQGWLSAHVYLGSSLLIIATLHTGFQLGWNLHTLSYVLMVLVILSGFYGVYVYVRYPQLITTNQRDRSREKMFEELDSLNCALLNGATRLNEEAHRIMLQVVDDTVIGGGVRKQLAGVDHFTEAQHSKKKIEKLQKQFIDACQGEQQSKLNQISELLKSVSHRNILLEQINVDISYQSILEYWLYFHVPISFALLAALLAHIVTVFFYW